MYPLITIDYEIFGNGMVDLFKDDCRANEENSARLALSRIAKICNRPTALLDTGNVVAPVKAHELGFSYRGLGRQTSRLDSK